MPQPITRSILALIFLSALLLFTNGSVAAENNFINPPSVFDSLNAPAAREHWRQGERIANALTTLTGEAMCPFLGIGIHGAYSYYRTPPDARAELPWHYQPWCWGIALGLAALVMLNATGGEMLTPLIKTPLTAIGEMVGIGGAAAAIPIAAGNFASQLSAPLTNFFASLPPLFFSSAIAAENAAAATSDWLTTLSWGLTFSAGVVIAAAVWVCWHIVDVFVLLSPFPFIDALLRGGRALLMGGLFALSAFSPTLGMCAALLMIAICARLAGWCGRLLIYYWLRFYDFLRPTPPRLPLRAFSEFGLRECRRKTCGQLYLRSGGLLIFVYYRWLWRRRECSLPFDCYLHGNKICRRENGIDWVLLSLLPSAESGAGQLLKLSANQAMDNEQMTLVEAAPVG